MLTTLDALSTGNNQITYGVIVDDDDYVTLEQIEHWEKSGMLPKNTVIMVEERSRLINARCNEMFKLHPAEMYSQIVDDGFPLTQHWDAIFAAAKQLPALCWQERNDPDNATFLILSDRWMKAVGRFYPEYFPFWFADTWLAEVYKLAFGHPISVIQQLCMGGKRGTTQGMREVAFWFKFFAATRVERIEEAKRLCAEFGTTYMHRPDFIAEFEKADAYQLTQVPRYEAVFKANLGEPSVVYKNAKEKAFRWLHERGELACA